MKNEALIRAYQSFKGQQEIIDTPLMIASPRWVPGRYICEIVESSIKESDGRPYHYLRIRNEEGQSGFPFRCWLDTKNGILGCAKNLIRILGNVTGIEVIEGKLVLDYDKFFGGLEESVNACIGKYVEVIVKDSIIKRKDGTNFQNFYINRSVEKPEPKKVEKENTFINVPKEEVNKEDVMSMNDIKEAIKRRLQLRKGNVEPENEVSQEKEIVVENEDIPDIEEELPF